MWYCNKCLKEVGVIIGYDIGLFCIECGGNKIIVNKDKLLKEVLEDDYNVNDEKEVIDIINMIHKRNSK